MADDKIDAWGYVRLSQQGRDGSLDEQLKAIREYAADTERLNLVTTLNEGASTSGFNAERPKYQRLMGKARDEDLGAIIVRDRARLSRDFDDRLRALADFRDRDIELHVLEDGGQIDIQNVQTASMECVHAAMDHVKKMAEIERAREATRKRVEDPDVDHGRPRYGMEYDESGRKQVPGENFEHVLEVLRWDGRGKSAPEIAEMTPVSVGTVYRILDRREWYVSRSQLVEDG